MVIGYPPVHHVVMATSPPGAEPWTLEHRGPFLVGRCVTCGYAGPARRAHYSVEMDMQAHEVLCPAARTTVPAAVEPSAADLATVDRAAADRPEDPPAHAGAAGRADDVQEGEPEPLGS